MKKYLTIILIILITSIGAFLRFYDNTKNPPSLNIDEVAYGYNAYSILKTGRDEYGEFLPLTFRSVGDYKSPVLIYSLVPSIAIFGLNEFSVRFTTALAGVLSIPLMYFLLLALTKKKPLAIVGAGFLAISPWHIYFSRYASDHMMALFFLILGTLFFLKLLEGSKMWAIPAGFTMALSMYTYHSEKIFIPLFVLAILIMIRAKLKAQKAKILIFLATGFIFLLPLVVLMLFGKAGTRAGMIFLPVDIDYTRYIIMDHLRGGIGEPFLLFFFWAKRYLNYFQADFLFFTGLDMTLPGTLGLGVMYLFEIPWLIWGIIELIRQKLPYKGIVILWVLLGLFPASITNNEQSAGRAIIIVPPLVYLSALGAVKFFSWIRSLKPNLQVIVGVVYGLIVTITLVQAWLVFAVHFPNGRGEYFMEGSREAALFAIQNQDQYKEIVFDPKRGVQSGNVVSIPYMYLLFYSKYDPATYQNEVKNFEEGYSHFGKFTIRSINWGDDREKIGTLFIGSSWSLPTTDVKSSEVLKRFYMTNGQEAYLAVTPKL